MKKRSFEYFCDGDYTKIENYEKAKADNFKGWDCHHRLELVSTGGVCNVERQDLIDWNLYWHRPADELIFLTKSEHMSLHSNGNKRGKGYHHSEETRKKISEASKGRPSCNKGKKIGPRSEETKAKISKALKGKNTWAKGKSLTDEHKNKISETLKGHSVSEESRKKMTESHKGKHYKLVDGKRVWY